MRNYRQENHCSQNRGDITTVSMKSYIKRIKLSNLGSRVLVVIGYSGHEQFLFYFILFYFLTLQEFCFLFLFFWTIKRHMILQSHYMSHDVISQAQKVVEGSRRSCQSTCIQHGDLEINMRKKHKYKSRVNYQQHGP